MDDQDIIDLFREKGFKVTVQRLAIWKYLNSRVDHPSADHIYRALKRDHPGMPAEMKARIASRQGKPGKQSQGPPYKGPITSTYES